MKKSKLGVRFTIFVFGFFAAWLHAADSPSTALQLTPQDALETHGLSVFVFHNSYHGVFGDEKMSGVEIVLHDERVATNGDVRLSPTPAQWDPIPKFQERKRGASANELIASLAYPDRDLAYRIDVRPEAGGFRVAVQLDHPLPAALAGKAGFNLESLPTAFFGKSYLLDGAFGIFPRHPGGPMEKQTDGTLEPLPLARGNRILALARRSHDARPHHLRKRSSHAVRRPQSGAERMVRCSHPDSFRQNGRRCRLARSSERRQRLDATADCCL